MNTRKEQAEHTKQKILEATYSIVRDEGIHALSSLKIVEMAGISKGGFFHHFPQIEDLYLYMLDQLMQQFDEDLSPKKCKTVREFIRSSTNYIIEMLEASPENVTTLFYFLSQSGHKPEYKKRIEAMLGGMFARWANDISHFCSPKLSPAHKDHIIRILDMHFIGFSFHYLILGNKTLYRKVSDDFADMLTAFIDKEVL